MRSMRALALVTLIGGCGGKKDPPSTRDQVPPPVADDSEDPPEPVAAAVFPEGTRSLELVRTVGVRLEPGDDAKRIGTVAVDTRVAWVRTQKGKGCQKPWVEIRPH